MQDRDGEEANMNYNIQGRHGWFVTAFLWAFNAGGVGLVGGFFGPMIICPGLDQGPLLGIFITGPLGFIFGGVAGLIFSALSNKSRQRRDTS
jgi:hypothetical protein